MSSEIVVALLALNLVLFLIGFAILIYNASRPHPRLEELNDRLNELKTRQLEAQNSSLKEQQELFLQIQNNLVQQLATVQKTLNDSLSSTQQTLNQRLGDSNRVIQDIQVKLGTLETTTKHIQEIGKDIAGLQNILSSPKLRGGFGEYLLENFLKDVLPRDKYELQYTFRNGKKVDAIIRIADRLVPIDSKFPLDSFRRLQEASADKEKRDARAEFERSIKERVDEIARSYILPGENTFDFALMYVPAENVYYELIVNKDQSSSQEGDLLSYAWKRKVIPVSPNSFYAYLMMIVYGLRGLQIEKRAQEIQGQLGALQERFRKFYEDFNTLGKHLGNAKTKFDEAQRKAEHFNDQLNQITNAKMELPTDTGPSLPQA